MIRRFRIPATLVLVLQLSLFAAIPLTQTACPGDKATRSEALGWAEEALAITRDVLPVFTSIGFSSTNVELGIRIGGDLVAAMKANNDADALTQVAAFIDVTDSIARDTDLFKNPAKQTLALAILAGARIVLRRISDHLKPAEDAGMLRAEPPGSPRRTAAAKVREFSKSPAWRCRSSETGRFQKMEFCRQNPGVSQVERVRQRADRRGFTNTTCTVVGMSLDQYVQLVCGPNNEIQTAYQYGHWPTKWKGGPVLGGQHKARIGPSGSGTDQHLQVISPVASKVEVVELTAETTEERALKFREWRKPLQAPQLLGSKE